MNLEAAVIRGCFFAVFTSVRSASGFLYNGYRRPSSPPTSSRLLIPPSGSPFGSPSATPSKFGSRLLLRTSRQTPTNRSAKPRRFFRGTTLTFF